MASLNFPSSPADGNQYSLNGVTYTYNATIGAWLTNVVGSSVTANTQNTQIIFNDGGVANGSFGLVFDKTTNTVTQVNQFISGNTIFTANTVTLRVPIGTTSQRPTGTAGVIRYNTDLGTFEGYNASSWGAIGGVGAVDLTAANNWSNTKLANASGTVYRGDLYFANGNIAIGMSSVPSTDLYVMGSSAASVNTLVDGATITPIFGGTTGNNNFTVTLAGNRVLANPTNPIVGQSGVIYVVQDSTGSRTLSYGNQWKFQGNVAPTLSTSASAVDMIVYSVRTTANIAAQLINNIG